MLAEKSAHKSFADPVMAYGCHISLRMGFRPSTGARRQKGRVEVELLTGSAIPAELTDLKSVLKSVDERRFCAGRDGLACF